MKKNFAEFSGKIINNYPLKEFVYYRIGGNAKFFLLPKHDEDIAVALDECKKKGIPFFILGSGSNLLVEDHGFDGAILALGHSLSKDIKIVHETNEEITLEVPSHWPKAKLLQWALKHCYSGLEFSAGIPGTIGGAVFMNAGTKWGNYSQVIEEVKLFSVKNGFYSKSNEQMGFKYRGIGEGILDGSTIVVSATMKLKKEKKQGGIRRVVDEILCYRGTKQPLELPNCGSVFKNPENSERGAGRLIEAAGLKGTRIGNAEISLKHANFILNLGGAKAQDVKALISIIQEVVHKKFNIALEREVIYL